MKKIKQNKFSSEYMKNNLSPENQEKWDKAMFISGLIVVLPSFFSLGAIIRKLIDYKLKSITPLSFIIPLLVTFSWSVLMIIYGKLLIKKQRKFINF